MSLTNLIVLALSIITNTQPGDGTFVSQNGRLVGIQSITYAVQQFSVGFMNGTNPVELFEGRKLLWARTNTIEFPIVTGVGMPVVTVNPTAKLQSTPATIASNVVTITREETKATKDAEDAEAPDK